MTPVQSESKNYPDLEKNRDFLFKLVYKSYENDIKSSESTNTVLGFLITANGVILLAMINVIQLTNALSFNIIFWIAICFNLLFIFLSTWSSISYVVVSKPTSFVLERTPIELVNQTYAALHEDAFNALNVVIEANSETFTKYRKLLIFAWFTFGLSLLMIVMDIGLYAVYYVVK